MAVAAGGRDLELCYHKMPALADPRGGTRDARPPGGPNSFIFMQFSAKIINKHTHFGVGTPPGENPRSATGQ